MFKNFNAARVFDIFKKQSKSHRVLALFEFCGIKMDTEVDGTFPQWTRFRVISIANCRTRFIFTIKSRYNSHVLKWF